MKDAGNAGKAAQGVTDRRRSPRVLLQDDEQCNVQLRMRVRLVDIHSARYAIARRYMIRLRRDDFDDPFLLAKYAATAGLSLEAFRQRFEHLIGDEPPGLQLGSAADLLVEEPPPGRSHSRATKS